MNSAGVILYRDMIRKKDGMKRRWCSAILETKGGEGVQEPLRYTVKESKQHEYLCY